MTCAFLILAMPRKIFKTRNLHIKYSKTRTCCALFGGLTANVFQISFPKISIPGWLGDSDLRFALQNIVKEGLTRKIFRNKGLARPES